MGLDGPPQSRAGPGAVLRRAVLAGGDRRDDQRETRRRDPHPEGRVMTASPIAGSAAIGAPAAAATGPGLTVRPTTPADLPAVVSLLSERDGHALEPGNV